MTIRFTMFHNVSDTFLDTTVRFTMFLIRFLIRSGGPCLSALLSRNIGGMSICAGSDVVVLCIGAESNGFSHPFEPSLIARALPFCPSASL